MLYCLAWDNGLEYEDHTITDLGFYSSRERREEAKEWYTKLHGKQWPFHKTDPGMFTEWECDVDEDLVKKHPNVKVEE